MNPTLEICILNLYFKFIPWGFLCELDCHEIQCRASTAAPEHHKIILCRLSAAAVFLMSGQSSPFSSFSSRDKGMRLLFRGSSLPVLHAACSVSGTKQKIVSSRSGPWRSRSHSLSVIALNSSHHCANNHTPTKSQTVSQSSTVFAHFCTRSSHVDSTELSRICDSVQTNTTYPSCVSGAGSVPSSFHFHSCVCACWWETTEGCNDPFQTTNILWNSKNSLKIPFQMLTVVPLGLLMTSFWPGIRLRSWCSLSHSWD